MCYVTIASPFLPSQCILAVGWSGLAGKVASIFLPSGHLCFNLLFFIFIFFLLGSSLVFDIHDPLFFLHHIPFFHCLLP